MFNVLRSMNFFKHYISGKIFNLWKGIVRYLSFKRTRYALSQNLLYSKQAFVGPFMTINSLMYETQTIKMFNISKVTKNWELDEFTSEQKGKIEEAKKQSESTMVTVIKVVDDVVANVTDSLNVKQEEDLDQNKIGQKAKHKSMVKMKEEQKLTQKCNKLAARNESLLGNFIRLIDYMEVETLAKLNQDAIDLIYSEMAKSRKNGINTLVMYGQEKMDFSRSDSDVSPPFHLFHFFSFSFSIFIFKFNQFIYKISSTLHLMM